VKRSAVIALSLLTAAVSGTAFFVSPYYAVREITNAARDRDFITLNEHVDYPAIRENLKDQVAAKVAAEVRRANGVSGAFELLESAAADAILDKIIDLTHCPRCWNKALFSHLAPVGRRREESRRAKRPQQSHQRRPQMPGTRLPTRRSAFAD
jgi:Protein of unknown function (DUF2939)